MFYSCTRMATVRVKGLIRNINEKLECSDIEEWLQSELKWSGVMKQGTSLLR